MTPQQTIEQAIADLESVLCNREGNVCIAGSNGDRKVAQDALTNLRALREQMKKQEPVAKVKKCRMDDRDWLDIDPLVPHDNFTNGQLLYTAPQLPQREGWQPIETAPKDGSVILLCRLHPNPDIRIAVSDGQWLETRNGHWDWVWPYIRKEPTHWMPLPAAPKPTEGE